MTEPAREIEPKDDHDITPPFLTGLKGGGETTPGGASLSAVESNPEPPNTGSVADQEASGSNVVKGPWKTNVPVTATDMLKPGGLVAVVKKKSPMLAIVITLAGLVTGVGIFGGSTLLPMGIVANVVQKFNPAQETSLSIRTNRMLVSKLVKGTTTGSCSVIKIACRYTRPSNRFLAQLEKNGIQLMDSKGRIVKASKWLPNTRPKSYRYFNNESESVVVEAKNLKRILLDDDAFRARFSNATRTRFMSVTDNVFNTIKARFTFNTNDRLKDTPDEKAVTGEVDELSALDDNGAKAAANAGTAEAEVAAETFAKNELKTTAEEILEKLGKAGKGDAIILAAGAACLISDTPSIIIKANRAFQMAQLIKYSAVFLSAFGAIKAGDATPAEAGAIGAVLTKVVADKSAMDSFGMRYVMTGDKLPKKTDGYKAFSPGSSMIKKFGGMAKLSNNTAKIQTCKYMMNPVAGASLNAVMAGTGVGIVAAAVNFAAGYVIGTAIEKFAPTIVDLVIENSPISMTSILEFFFGDLTKGLKGEAVGDALTSGAAHMMGQTANAGGNMPLTVPQAVAYDNATKQVQLAYAKEDRATKSPLDASSQNTFLGSIVQKLIPYFTSSGSTLGSFSNTFSSISNTVVGSFGLALNPLAVSAASPNGDEYKLCDDPEITGNGTAAGPFCNIIYGVPTKYLDKDPVDVMNNLIVKGEIDEDTGEPKEGLKDWVELCTDGTTDQANNCKITDETADYALYTIDHRIQVAMDEDDTTTSSTPPTTTDPTTPDTPSTGDAKQLAQQILANNKIDLSYVGSAGVAVKKDVQAAANGKKGSAGAMTSAAILQLIANLGKNHTVSVSAIQSGGMGHSTGSKHYKGDAVDFSVLDGTVVTGRNRPSFTIIRAAEEIWPTGSAFGQKLCGPAAPLPRGWSTFNDGCTHLHLDVPAGTP